MAATLFVVVGTGVIAGLAGLSMALGAFVAGLLLAETEFRKAIETTIEPFKGLLLGVFFFTVGMSIDLRELAREPLWLLGVGGRPHRHQGRPDHRPGAPVSRAPAGGDRDRLLLGPAASSPSSSSAWPRRWTRRGASASFTLAVTSLTMVLIPLLASLARRLHRAQPGAARPLEPALTVAPPADREQGPRHRRRPRPRRADRVRHARAALASRSSPPTRSCRRRALSPARPRGLLRRRNRPAFLKSCGVMDAAAVIVTIHDQAAIDEIVRACARCGPTS